MIRRYALPWAVMPLPRSGKFHISSRLKGRRGLRATVLASEAKSSHPDDGIKISKPVMLSLEKAQKKVDWWSETKFQTLFEPLSAVSYLLQNPHWLDLPTFVTKILFS